MRIVAGTWRGRILAAPAGSATRPTADRVRQALFDMLLHAPWAGSVVIRGARVRDAFAGTGALGLEALSRGAAHAVFMERDRSALTVLRANIAACRAEALCEVLAADSTRPPPGLACGLVFLDPPYGRGLVPASLLALRQAGWITPDALVVVETGHDEDVSVPGTLLDDRRHGAARITVWNLFA